ncbi:hypothetical protein ACMYYO_10035 [Dermacoccaceae bacterium W4C1]
MNSTPPAPLNAVEHQLATVAQRPGDRDAVLRLFDMVANGTLGVAGRSYANFEFTPYLVGSRDRYHVVAFTHPARFEQFRAVVRPDADVSTQPLTGIQTFERCVPSQIPLLLNPQAPWTYEFSVAAMSGLLRGPGAGLDAEPTQSGQVVAGPDSGGTGPIRPPATPVQGTPTFHGPSSAATAAPVPPGPGPGGMHPPAGPPMPATVAPPFVVPGLYERLAHYFDWLAGIDEAMLGWQQRPDGPTYLLRIRTRMPAAAVHAHLGRALGDLQGHRMDVVVDDWSRPPWTDPVAPFYRARH